VLTSLGKRSIHADARNCSALNIEILHFRYRPVPTLVAHYSFRTGNVKDEGCSELCTMVWVATIQ
jgi:hypothetical protein